MTPLSTRSGRSAAHEAKAPLRLGEGGGTEFERQLVSSASRDGVPAASMAKVAAGLRAAVAGQAGAATAGASLPVARAAGSFGALGNLRPWAIAVGAAIAGAGVVAAIQARDTRSAAPAGRAPVEPVAVLVKPPGEARLSPPSEPPPPIPTPSSRLPDAPRRPPPAARAKPVREPPRSDAVSSGAGAELGLAAEVRAIESVQTFLGWGQVQQATDALAHYRRQFPRGELALEADLLDVDVALARGDRSTAKQLARALLARPAASRYRARLEAIDNEPALSGPRAAGSIDRPGYMKERR